MLYDNTTFVASKYLKERVLQTLHAGYLHRFFLTCDRSIAGKRKMLTSY